MDDFITIGSHKHFIEPIKGLISMSLEIHKKYVLSKDSNVLQLLTLIPAIDSNKQNLFLNDIKDSNFKANLQKFGCNSTFDSNQFNNYSFLQKYEDIESVLIFLHCILWSLNPIDQRDFAQVLSILEKTKDRNQMKIHNFCFELVLNKALSAASMKGNFGELFAVFLNYIISLQNLPETSYFLLVALFHTIAEDGTESDRNLLKKTIEHLLIHDFDCLIDKDLSLILDIIKVSLNNMDKENLMIFSMVINRSRESKNVMEIVHNLYKSLIDLISEVYADDKEDLFKSDENNISVHIEKPTRVPQNNSKLNQNRDSSSFKLVHPPYIRVSFSQNSYPRILQDKIFSKVMNFAGILSHTSKEVVFDFIAQFTGILVQKEHFIEFCSVFLEILIRVADQNTAPTAIELLSQTVLFSPECTVFNKLDQKINFLRYQVFEIIAHTDPSQVSVLIRAAQRDPFLLNEHLLRILLIYQFFDPMIFSEEPIRTILIYSALDLQSLTQENCVNLDIIRSSNFAFISSVICQTDSCDCLFSSPMFVNAFFSFIYEKGFENIIFDTFKRALALMKADRASKYSLYIVSNFQKLIYSSIEEKNYNNDQFPIYHQLTTNAFNSLIIGLKYNISIAHYFVLLFDAFLDFINVSPTFDLIMLSLKFFQILCNTETYWELTPRHFSILYSAIKKVCGDEPDERIVTNIFCCLENSYFLHSSDHILILFPSVLPLLFLLHSNSTTTNISLLKCFLNLCKYSRSNTAALHDGFIDLLLIQYLCICEDKGSIKFNDQIIEFHFDREEAMPFMLELLSNIITSKSNFSIAANIMKLLSKTKDKRIVRFILDLMLNGSSEFNRTTKILLDTSEPFIQIQNFDWNSICNKNVFILDFDLNMDEMISRRFSCSFSLFNVSDGTNSFNINIKNGLIKAFFITPEKTSTAFLFRNIFHVNWLHFSIIVSKVNDKTKIFNFMNKERLTDATIDPIFFNGPVKILIGGSDFVSNVIKHPCFGQIYDFKFFPFKLCDEELDILVDAPHSLLKTPIFSTSMIKSEMKRLIEIEYNNNSNVLNTSNNNISVNNNSSTIKFTLELLSTFHRTLHILDFISETSLFPDIINLEDLEVALDILFYIFSKHPDIQKFFKNYIDGLFNNVLKNTNFSIYISLFRFLGILVDERIKLIWFEKFIINIVLWSKSDQFQKILYHWSFSVKHYRAYFENKNYFNDLLTQFMLRYTDDDTKCESTMKVFCAFMVKISRLNFDKTSFETLLSCLLICENESNLWDLVKILFSISTTQAAQITITKQKITFLHKLFQYQNPQLTALTTFCIHNLSVNIKDYDPIAISYSIIGHKDLDLIVDLLLAKLPQFPDLLPLLVILSIQTKKMEKISQIIGNCVLNDNCPLYSIMKRDFWYIWPILLMLNVTKGSCDICCTFLAQCMSKIESIEKMRYIDEIFALLFRISFLRPNFDIILHILHHLVSAFKLNDRNVPEYISRYCFVFFFLHIPEYLHSDPILELYNEYYHNDSTESLSSPPDFQPTLDSLPNSSSKPNTELTTSESDSSTPESDLTTPKSDSITPESDSIAPESDSITLGYDSNSANSNESAQTKLDSKGNIEHKKGKNRNIGVNVFDYKSNSPFNVFELESLLAFDFFKFNILCRVNIDVNSILKETFYAELFMSLEPPKAPLFDKKLIQYFSDPKSLDDQVRMLMSLNLTNILDDFKTKISSHIINELKIIKKGIILLFQESKKTVSAYQSDDSRHFTHLFLSKASSELQKNTPKIEKKQAKILTRKATIISPGLFPYKIKLSIAKISTNNLDNLNSKNFCESGNEGQHGNPIHRCTCLLSHFNTENNKKRNFYLFEDKFIITSKKKRTVILFENILYLMTRKLEQSCGYEVYTFDLKICLFFFTQNDFTSINMYLKTFHFPNSEMVILFGDVPNLSGITKEWKARRMSNFDYLMRLNIFSGHSFNQYHLYPLMPPVVSDYDDFESVPNFDDLITTSLSSASSSQQSDMFDMEIKENFTNNFTVIADYYFDLYNATYHHRNFRQFEKANLGEDETNDTALLQYPKWAKNRYEFIYKNRKKLEKIDITPFIDRVFGYLKDSLPTNSKCSFIKLFKREHVKRDDDTNESPNDFKVFEFNQNILSVTTFLKKNDKIVFWLILEDKKVHYSELSITEGRLKSKSYNTLQCGCDNPIFSYSSHNIFAYSRSKAQLYYLSSVKTIRVIPLFTELPLFATLGEQILFCRDECLLCKMNIDGTNYQKYCFTDSKVTALVTSKYFKVVVFATMDGIVHVYDFESAKQIKQYDIGYQVKQLVVTTVLGFIVAMSDEKVTIFNVNGEFISKYSFNFLIRKIFIFSLRSGFDFVSFETFENEIGYFEVFYPEKYVFLKKFSSMVQRISYDPIHRLFIIVELNGHIEIIPHFIEL